MAQISPNFSPWSSSSEANLCDKFYDCTSIRDSALSMDLDQSAGLQLEQVTAFHYPTRIQFQRQDLLGSADSRHDSGEVLRFQSAYNELSNDLLSRDPEVSPLDSSVITGSRIPNLTRSHTEEVFPALDHHQVEVPARKIKTGRRRRMSDGTPDGWVASKNLISERKRREKLQKGLITLRELVPMFTMKMDRVSILIDAINYLQELKRTVEMLETEDIKDEDLGTDRKDVEEAKNSCYDMETSDAENEGDQRKNSSVDGSFCSEVSDAVGRYDRETSPLSRDWTSNQIQLDVIKLDHGMYKLDLICTHQSGILVQISQAIESFVIEIVHTNIIVISSTKVTCTYVVKMSSWNEMTLEDVKADTIKLLGSSGLEFSECAVKGNV